MARGYYILDEEPVYTDQVERLVNTDPVRAENSFFESLILRILNNAQALYHGLKEVQRIAGDVISSDAMGAANGVATLNANRKLAQMPTAADVGALPSNTAYVPPTRKVAGKALSADITLTKADVGLGSVDNTADSAKSVKYATSAGSTTGNAGSATKLATARTIGISGGATGTATSFNGSANITIPVTALDVSKATAGTLPVARGGTGQTNLNNVTVGKANACNGLTFAVAAAAPTTVTNNKVTFVYG